MDTYTTDTGLALWGGIECTVNRVRDNYFSQMERNGHAERDHDIERFASTGIKAIRYPILWERTAPGAISDADWSWPDARLPALRELGITVIAGLVHHGSGPRHTSLLDPDFAGKLADYAGAVAARYPWIDHYTPVNEPLTTARFSGLAGVWYPHGRDEASFVQALLNQCRAVVLAMRAIRKINPCTKLVQTDDLSKTYATPEMAGLAHFFNERRWLGWDLLCGLVGPAHALWDYLIDAGASAAQLLWFCDNPCPPDIIGVNYYITSERWLDHRADRYPPAYRHHYRGHHHADIETARVLATPTPVIGPLLRETWERYRIPVAVTEAHIDAGREDQLRWLAEIWDAARQERQAGADIRAVTVWALLGSYDWNCLVTASKGYYEPGPFDVRGPAPRPTALAGLMRELASGRPPAAPVLQGQGWWRRPERFLARPVPAPSALAALASPRQRGARQAAQPLLITGAGGTLGQAFARLCQRRNLACHVLARAQLDLTDPAAVDAAIARYRPWAIVNAAGYVKVDQAETERARCMADNAAAPAVLAQACARHGIGLLSLSSDLVFDGSQRQPYVESDAPNPLSVYGHSKVSAEARVLAAHPQSLVVRSSAFFGPWDRHNFVSSTLDALAAGIPVAARDDITVSPTYVPDLAATCLDLLIDGERGIWHLSNHTAVSWAQLARRAAAAAGLDDRLVEPVSGADPCQLAARPVYSVLGSERGILLPSLDVALQRYATRYAKLRRHAGLAPPLRAGHAAIHGPQL